MKLSVFLSSLRPLDPQSDPEILILLDSGELAPVELPDPADLPEGDPVLAHIASSGGALILRPAQVTNDE